MTLKDDQSAFFDSYSRWELPALNAHAASTSAWLIPKNNAPGLSFPTVQELEAIRHAAHQEGIDQGILQGQKQISDAVSRLAKVAEQLFQPIHQQDQQLQQVLAQLVVKICKVVLQRELCLNSTQITKIVQEALSFLPAENEQTVIYLNAKDFESINHHKKDIAGWRDQWTIKVHANLAPGGCVVESAKTRIDATIEHRFNQAVAALLANDELLSAQDCALANSTTTTPPSVFNDHLQSRSEFLGDYDHSENNPTAKENNGSQDSSSV